MASDAETVRYDFVVFGATGFTGQFVVEELARTIEEEQSGITWAVAGRSMSKLQEVLAEAQRQTGKNLEDLPIITADVKSEQSLKEMCQKAKIVLSCVGPYRLYGDPVIRACIESGSHYLDICGEPGFLEKVQLVYNSKAKEKGIYIIGACGWDSIPGELLLQYTRDKFDGDLNFVEGYLSNASGPEGSRMNFGTWQSAVRGYANANDLKATRKLLFTTEVPRSKHKLPRRSTIFYSEEMGNYCAPFVGADASVIRRTQRLNYENENLRPVQFTAYKNVPTTLELIRLIFVGLCFFVFTKFSFGQTLLETFPYFFSGGMFTKTGPTRKQIEGATFSWTFIGQGYDKKIEDPKVQHDCLPTKKTGAKVTGPEPGYASTPICLVQAGYTLLAQQDKLPPGGGVLTPGFAFAKTNLTERLEKHNHKFQPLEF